MKWLMWSAVLAALSVGAVPVAAAAKDAAVAAVASTAMGHLFGRCGDCRQVFRTRHPCAVDTVELGTCGCGGSVQRCEAPVTEQVHGTDSVVPSVAVEPIFETRTILIPELVTEVRDVEIETCVPVEKSREVTVIRTVPIREERTREVTRMVVEDQSRVETYTVQVPFVEEQVQNYTVEVPIQVVKTTTRTVRQQVPVTSYRTVREDQGHWQVEQVAVAAERSCGTVYSAAPSRSRCRVGLFGRLRLRRNASHCGRISDCGSQSSFHGSGCQDGCGDCEAQVAYVTRKVWVPNIVEHQVEVTCYKTVEVEVPHEYAVTEYRTEERSRTVPIDRCRDEVRERVVTFQVCVPKVEIETYEHVSYQQVPETHTVNYTELVPTTVTKQIEVQVQRMIEKTIQVRVGGCEVSHQPAACGCR